MQEQRNSVARDALGSNGTVAGITSTVRTAVPLEPENGLNHGSVVNLADIQTIRQMNLGRHVGYLFPRGEPALTAAFGLDL